MMWFIVFVFVGVFLWLANLHIVALTRDWPVILIVLGVSILLSIYKKRKKTRVLNDLEHGKISLEEAEDRLKNS